MTWRHPVFRSVNNSEQFRSDAIRGRPSRADARTGEPVRVLTHQPSVPMAVHSADGETEIRKFPNGVDSIAISSDGGLLATHALDGKIRVWDLSSGEVVWQIEALVDRMIFAGRSLVVAAGDLIRIWETQSGTERASLIQDARVKDIKCDAAGRFIVVLTYRGQAGIWDLTTAARVIQTAADEKVAAVDLSADGRYWILGTEGMTGCWLWRPDDLIEVAEAYVRRNMSEQDWRNFVGDEPFRPTFQLGKESS
jgi:WD40 repeat protein